MPGHVGFSSCGKAFSSCPAQAAHRGDALTVEHSSWGAQAQRVVHRKDYSSMAYVGSSLTRIEPMSSALDP